MEKWNFGMLEYWAIKHGKSFLIVKKSLDSSFHYSTIPENISPGCHTLSALMRIKGAKLSKKEQSITCCKSFRMALICPYKGPNTVWNSYPE